MWLYSCCCYKAEEKEFTLYYETRSFYGNMEWTWSLITIMTLLNQRQFWLNAMFWLNVLTQCNLFDYGYQHKLLDVKEITVRLEQTFYPSPTPSKYHVGWGVKVYISRPLILPHIFKTLVSILQDVSKNAKFEFGVLLAWHGLGQRSLIMRWASHTPPGLKDNSP